MHDGPLDMRYDTRQSLTAEDIVNAWSRDDLAELFRRLGEEPRAAYVAKAIFLHRRRARITRTAQLAEIIASVIPRTGKMHPATRVFQALRIAVNAELDAVAEGVDAAIATLAPGGRLAVISFHSLEDRVIKQKFLSDTRVRVLTKRPIVASRNEQMHNPRSRSAKLRIAEKI